MTAKEIRKFIISKHTDCALLIGNGINRYAQSGCSWDTLLKALAHTFCPQLDIDEIPQGISNTEFFDLLDINMIREMPIYDVEKLKSDLHNLVIPKELITRTEEQMRQIANRKPFSLDNLKSIRTSNVSLKLPKDFDTDLAMTLSTLGDKIKPVLRNKQIDAICSLMRNWNYAPIHRQVSKFALKYNLPILTTNYDDLLAKSICAKSHDFKHDASSEIFPFSYCFTDLNNTEYDKFGIWHINGTIHQPKSILIGQTHYMRSVEKIRSLIFPPNRFNSELFIGNHWGFCTLKNTWINLIFAKHLIIAGLNLGNDEVLLRWLLIERAKYYSLYPSNRKKGWFIISNNDRIDSGKEYFLNNIGFEVLRVPDYDSIYKIISA